MQLEDSAALGSGGCDVEEVRLDNGEVCRNPPKALWVLLLLAAMVMVDGFLRANGYRYSTDRHPVSDTPKYVSNV
jgi:hypothetical protein